MPADRRGCDASVSLPAQVRDLLAGFGVDSRRPRAVLRRLAEGRWWTVRDLVSAAGASRRTVEALLAAAAPHVERRGDAVRVAAGYRHAYLAVSGRGGRGATSRTGPGGTERVDPEPPGPEWLGSVSLGAGPAGVGPAEPVLPRHADAVEAMRDLIEAAPAPRPALDHVPATPETAVRRAAYLGTRFWLDGASLLFLGDHDLTSLSTALLCRDAGTVEMTVVDIDERILSYIDREARRRGLPIRCLYADLRLGLPPSALECADLVFTDPPYTPSGVELFLVRALQGLRDRSNGRVLMAYGYGEGHPALGVKVQKVIARLDMACEAILPGFNRYDGAEAIGGASDLYVCRPTSRTWAALERAGRPEANIYTKGPQAAGAAGGGLDEAAAEQAIEVASRAGPVGLLVGAWPPRVAPGIPRTGLAAWMSGRRSERAGGCSGGVAIDLAGAGEGALLRALLAARAPRVAVVVGNGVGELRSAAGQRELSELASPAYDLRFLRSVPRPDLAVVVGRRSELAGDADAVLRWIYDRPHGKIANAWREGLIALARRWGGEALTKRAARSLVAEHAEALRGAGEALLELPRHRLRELRAAVSASVDALTALTARPAPPPPADRPLRPAPPVARQDSGLSGEP